MFEAFWSRNPISSALGSLVMMSSNDATMIAYLLVFFYKNAPWENQHVTIALIALTALIPYAVWILFKIYLILVTKMACFPETQ